MYISSHLHRRISESLWNSLPTMCGSIISLSSQTRELRSWVCCGRPAGCLKALWDYKASPWFYVLILINIKKSWIKLQPPGSFSFAAVVQLLSCVQFFVTPWTASGQVSVSFTISQSFPQIHVHWAGDAIQPSHPLLPSSPPTLNLFQHQSLFQWVGASHQVGKILELQHQSFQWIFKVDFH